MVERVQLKNSQQSMLSTGSPKVRRKKKHGNGCQLKLRIQYHVLLLMWEKKGYNLKNNVNRLMLTLLF